MRVCNFKRTRWLSDETRPERGVAVATGLAAVGATFSVTWFRGRVQRRSAAHKETGPHY